MKKGFRSLAIKSQTAINIVAHLSKLATGLMSDNFPLLTYSLSGRKGSIHHQLNGADDYPVARFSACFSQGFPYPVPNESLLDFC